MSATCGTCRWFRIYAPDYPQGLGRCLFPLPTWMRRDMHGNVVSKSTDGCETHQPKETRDEAV